MGNEGPAGCDWTGHDWGPTNTQPVFVFAWSFPHRINKVSIYLSRRCFLTVTVTLDLEYLWWVE